MFAKALNSISLTKVATATSLFLGMIATPVLAFGPQSSSKASEWGFDFVEEFDGLQDWDQSDCRNGASPCGNRHVDFAAQRMPKLEDDTMAAWNYFSVWNLNPAPAPWIGSETASGRKIWRGSKSLTIDMGSTNFGPSRLGLRLGNGYKDFRVFYMLWIPKNMFPTSCIGAGCAGGGPIGVYEDGKPYAYFAAWKFNTYIMDCYSADRCLDPYGPHYGIAGMQQYNYTPKGLALGSMNTGSIRTEDYRALDAGISLNHLMGDWWGFEMRIRNISNDSAYLMDMWVYDKNGQSAHIMREHQFSISPTTHPKVWDQFFFGGNNSNSWTWGPTMQSHYYIDDFIVDAGQKGQIGPRYFGLINGEIKSPPSPPLIQEGRQVQQ